MAFAASWCQGMRNLQRRNKGQHLHQSQKRRGNCNLGTEGLHSLIEICSWRLPRNSHDIMKVWFQAPYETRQINPGMGHAKCNESSSGSCSVKLNCFFFFFFFFFGQASDAALTVVSINLSWSHRRLSGSARCSGLLEPWGPSGALRLPASQNLKSRQPAQKLEGVVLFLVFAGAGGWWWFSSFRV